MPVDPKLFERLEAMGEEAVRHDVALGLAGNPGSEHNNAVRFWLKHKEDERAAAAASRKESREEESLAISRKALSNSRLATRIAISAIVLSIVLAIQKIIEWYSK